MRRPRRQRRKTQSFDAMIPNILTMFAMCAGLTALRFGLEGRFEAAVEALIVAAVLDAFDGRIARMLNQTSSFGAHLDTLSDFLCFGIVPAVILYLWSLSGIGLVGWALALVFCVCCALRLARFNVSAIDRPSSPELLKFFTGVPSPVGAGLVLVPLVVSFYDTGAVGAFFAHPAIVGVFVVGVAVLMISQLPTFSLKQVHIPHRYRLPTMLGVAIFAAAVVGATWETMTAMSLVYLLMLPVSWRAYAKQKEVVVAPEVADEEADGATDPVAGTDKGAADTVPLTVIENDRR